jgi:hypothetical protein
MADETNTTFNAVFQIFQLEIMPRLASLTTEAAVIVKSIMADLFPSSKQFIAYSSFSELFTDNDYSLQQILLISIMLYIGYKVLRCIVLYIISWAIFLAKVGVYGGLLVCCLYFLSNYKSLDVMAARLKTML